MTAPTATLFDSGAAASDPSSDGPTIALAAKQELLVRYGAIPDVVRVPAPEGVGFQRGERLVIRTRRGLELAEALDTLLARPVSIAPVQDAVAAGSDPTAGTGDEEHEHDGGQEHVHDDEHDHDEEHDHGDDHEHGHDDSPAFEFVRVATADDLARFDELRRDIRSELTAWEDRIREWNLELELLDGEWTLEKERLILYVLSGRGPDSTRLSLQAGALGVLNLDVQPVTIDGRVDVAARGGGGCGSGGCGCSH
jgi:hypothetical protein